MGRAEGERSRRLTVLVLVLATVLLLAAPILRVWVTPYLAQSPAVPALSTFTSTGTVTVLLDTESTDAEQPEPAPIQVTRTVTTGGDADGSARAQSAGYNAAVTTSLEQTFTSDGRLITETSYRLAADRATQALVDCCGAEVNGIEVPMAGAGSPLRLPWFTPPQSYPYLDTTLLTAVDMAYIGSDRVGDREAMKFQQATSPTAVGTVPVPGQLVGSEQPTVRLARTYAMNRSLWVDPTTGIILRTAERLRETLRDDAGRDVVTLLSMSLTSTPEQEAVQIAAADEEARPVLWTHSYGPLICLVLGSLLLLVGLVRIVLHVRERRLEEDFPDELASFEDLREAFD